MTQEERDMLYEDLKEFLTVGIKNLLDIYEKEYAEEDLKRFKEELKKDICILIDKFPWEIKKGGK